MAKPSKISAPTIDVRTRRAYFDFQHGQLHVRTAFPTTGGFDEQVTLFCLHGGQGSSRSFARLLPDIADVRSVYAPDLPGCGESDPSPNGTVSEAASAVADLAGDLRLRQIDLFGIDTGAAVALELAAVKPELVRRLVLLGIPTADRLPTIKQQAMVMAQDLFEAQPQVFAKRMGAFLSGRP